MVWTLWKFPVTGKHKVVLEEPSIPLYSDNDCGLEIEGIDLLSCNAPGCNLTVCKRAHTIFPLVLSKLIIFYSQYHMACRGELSKPQGGWFCDDECKKNAGFHIGKPWKPRHKVYMSINRICSNFGNQQTPLFSNRGRGGGVKKTLMAKKGMMYGIFPLRTPWFVWFLCQDNPAVFTALAVIPILPSSDPC